MTQQLDVDDALAVRGAALGEDLTLPRVIHHTNAHPPVTVPTTELGSVAIVGLGYVGLPTALGLFDQHMTVYGIDVSPKRLEALRSGNVDLTDADRERLSRALRSDAFHVGSDVEMLAKADAVVVCVPTPIDHHQVPDLGALRAACQTVVDHARVGQTIILTSTSYVGTTHDLVTVPLQRRGFTVGHDVFVAFSPERIDPGVAAHTQQSTPRVVGGETPQCVARATALLERLTNRVYQVSSPRAAEMTKLYENTFRAVTLALANEFAEICGSLALDPIEVTDAAATKPYGFLATYPGPGVGGHCIPCDPHYLLWQLRRIRQDAPVTQSAMSSISARPRHVVDRAAQVMSDAGIGLRDRRVIVVGVAYKPGVQDLRESSALEIMLDLKRRGAEVAFHDPLVPSLTLSDGSYYESLREPVGEEWDLAVTHTLHPGHLYSWLAECPRILDGTYRLRSTSHHTVV